MNHNYENNTNREQKDNTEVVSSWDTISEVPFRGDESAADESFDYRGSAANGAMGAGNKKNNADDSESMEMTLEQAQDQDLNNDYSM